MIRWNGRSGPVIAAVLLFFASTAGVVGQSFSTFDDAARWLEQHPQSPQYGSVLLSAVELAPNVESLQGLVERSISRVGNADERAQILLRLGVVQELSNRYREARLSYARALEADPMLWEASIRRASLSLESGDTSEAVVLLTRVINQAPTRTYQRRAALLRARAYLLAGEARRALAHARALTGYPSAGGEAGRVEASALFLLHEISLLTGADAERTWSEAALNALGADVPEQRLLAVDGASFYPTPSRILGGIAMETVPETSTRPPEDDDDGRTVVNRTDEGHGTRRTDDAGRADSAVVPPQEETIVGIQTGSFRVEENARYMAEDVRALGFRADVHRAETDDGIFYRVVVPLENATSTDDAQRTVVELKERGVEGFLIFDTASRGE